MHDKLELSLQAIRDPIIVQREGKPKLFGSANRPNKKSPEIARRFFEFSGQGKSQDALDPALFLDKIGDNRYHNPLTLLGFDGPIDNDKPQHK